MTDFEKLQILLKEAAEALQTDTKTSKRKAINKFRQAAGVAETIALLLEVNMK